MRLSPRVAQAIGSRKMGLWLRWFISAIKLGYIIIQDRNPENDLVPLVPRDAQQRVLASLIEQADANVPVRCLIPKARREGISTLIQALGVFLCANIPRFKALTVAHTKEAAEEIFGIAKLIVDNMPDAQVASVSAREITFKNGSVYACTTAGGKGVKRGATIHFLHLSEVAEYQSVSDMDTRALTSLLNTVALSSSTFIFMESTGAGPTGQFYKRCMSAMENGGTGQDGYKLCFLPWFYDEENRSVPIPGVEFNAYDLALKREFKLKDEQLWFYKRKYLEAISGGDKEFYFRREYPSRLMECFTGASGLVYSSFSDRNVRHIPLHTLRAHDRPGKPREFYRGIDWGQTVDPFAVLWVCHDPEAVPALTIDPSCRNLITEFQTYSFDEKKDYPEDANNHWCVAGDTRVLVKGQGWVEIEKLVGTEGECWTPLGWKPYFNCVQTKVADTLDVICDNGQVISGTHDHKIAVDRNGTIEWTTLGDLKNGDRLPLAERPDGSIGNVPGVSGEQVFSLQWLSLLRKSGRSGWESEKVLPAQGCMGSRERCSTEEVAYSSQGRQSGKQFVGQLGMRHTFGTCTIAPDARTLGAYESEPSRQCSPESVGMASLGRGQEVPSKDWGDVVSQRENQRIPMYMVRETSPDEMPVEGKTGEVLRFELQNGVSEVAAPRNGRNHLLRSVFGLRGEIQETSDSESMRQKMCRSAQMGYCRVESVRKGRNRAVFDLSVDHPIHAFVTRGGIVLSNCDALRYLVVSYNLTGHVHVYRELRIDNAAGIGLDGCARQIHLASGWRLPGLNEEETRTSKEMNLTLFQPADDIGEMYDGGVADRSQPMMISMMTRYGIPLIPHAKPHPKDQKRSEILDGIVLVNRLVIGATYLDPPKEDVHRTALERALENVGSNRPRRLTTEEQNALDRYLRETGGNTEPQPDYEWLYN